MRPAAATSVTSPMASSIPPAITPATVAGVAAPNDTPNRVTEKPWTRGARPDLENPRAPGRQVAGTVSVPALYVQAVLTALPSSLSGRDSQDKRGKCRGHGNRQEGADRQVGLSSERTGGSPVENPSDRKDCDYA